MRPRVARGRNETSLNLKQISIYQCCGSMIFWYGSGSRDPCLRILLFSSQQKTNFSSFFCVLLLEGTFTSFFKDKQSKRNHKTVGIKVSYYYFSYYCLTIEGSGSRPLTNGSGSGSRPKTYGSDGSRSGSAQHWY
jgi:hypothetical protein